MLQSTSSLLQAALTPAFLLVALGSMLGLFSGRLSRIVDRSRDLLLLHAETKGKEHDRIVGELRDLEKRIRTVNLAIAFGVLSAITVSLLIGILFLMALVQRDLSIYAAAAFMVAIALMVAALIMFMIEVRFAIGNVRIGPEYLELPEKQRRGRKN